MYRFFLIDDETWAMVALAHLIDWKSLGFEVARQIDNAQHAWELIKAEKPDVIVTDIRMPGLSGLELLRRIREEALPIEVVLVSAFADFSYAQEAIHTGAFEYLLKPVHSDKLLACFQHLADNLKQREIQRDKESAAVLRQRLSQCNTLTEAYETFAGRAVLPDEKPAVICCSGELAALLDDDPLAAHWVRIPWDNGEILCLCAASSGNELDSILSSFCADHGVIGGYGLVSEEAQQVSMESAVWLAQMAWHTARFVEAPGIPVRPGTGGSSWEIDLFRALQYNQTSVLASVVEDMRRDVKGGNVLLDKLFGLMRSIDGICRRTQENIALFPETWKRYTDMLREYPTSDALFDYLAGVLVNDSDETLLAPVLEEIEVRYARNRTLTDLSQELGISQGHLSQMIRRSTGKTYSELVQERRMERAKELLCYSEKPVMDIAIEVGYSDQFYFSKLFKRLWGMSPNAWRKHFRSGDEITK